MYIFADLNPDILLFTVKWLPFEQILIIYPDFNDFHHNPYYIEIDSDYRHLYSYAIENTSISEIDARINRFNLQLTQIPIQNSIDTNLNTFFEIPIKNQQRYLIHFQFMNAKNFDYDNIHIRYEIEIPKSIEKFIEIEINDDDNDNDENQLLISGSTHSIQKSYEQNLWNIGYSFEINLLTKEFHQHQQQEQNRFQVENHINLYLEVISIDSWKRERIEGYALQSIYLKSGCENYEINCYRIDYGYFERIERFFIGGRRKFDMKQFNRGFDGFLNRYQIRTITTGTVSLRTSILVQKCPDTITFNDGQNRTYGMTLEDIMKAYQEARKRLKATIYE